MSKIMNMPIKVGVHMYVMHAKSQTLYASSQWDQTETATEGVL